MHPIMSPNASSVGLPRAWTYDEAQLLAKFPPGFTPRPAQVQILKETSKAFLEGKRFVVVEAPTGVGKSHVAKTVADVVVDDGGAYMITAQKALQDQYERDYPAPQMELLKGRANYGCSHPNATDAMNAGDAVCHQLKKGILKDCVLTPPGWDSFDEDGEPKGLLQAAVRLELPAGSHRCPYWKQLQKCNDAKLTLFNFSSFLFQRRIGRFQKRALLVIDECHGIEAQLQNFVTIELTEWALSIVNVEIDRNITTREQLVEWLREKDVMGKIDKALGEGKKLPAIEADLGTQDDDESSFTEDLEKAEKDALTELKGKVENFLAFLNRTEWILETVEYFARGYKRRKVVGRPLYVKDFAEELLFQHADRVMFFSATILDIKLWAENLGIRTEDLRHVQTACEFPVENRPIHLEFAGNMGKKYFSPEENPSNPTKPRFVAKVKQILKRHEGQRGIIHSHSFELTKILKEEIGDPRFLFQEDFSGDKQLMMSAHASREDSVIVAPAMHEGYDFKDGLGRFQVIAKIPWPSLVDRLVKERMSRDDRYYGWLTALKLVQSYGRTTRSKTDWSYTYLIDAGFGGFFSRHGHMIPGWMKEAFKKYPPKPPIRRE